VNNYRKIVDEEIETGLRDKLDFVQHLPGRTHPRTEGGAMGGGLMMRVMGFMLDRLRIEEAVQKQRADDDEEGDGFTMESQHDTTHVNSESLEDAPYRCQESGTPM
jgi:hypothetical protein